jgi:hypothetical protein
MTAWQTYTPLEDGPENGQIIKRSINNIGGRRYYNCQMGAGRCGNIVQPAK